MPAPRTLLDRIWERHAVLEDEAGRTLLRIDRHFVHEGSFHAFDQLARRGLPVRRPDLTFGIADHYVPSAADRRVRDPEVAGMISMLGDNAARNGVALFGLDDPRQGIVHVVGPEQGLTLPGLVVVCGDSHTSSHGALGALGFGIGASEVAHVLATQTLWQRKPKAMRVRFSGRPPFGVAPKDLVMALIGRIGAGGATGHVVEYDGEAVRALSVEGRLTVCNMTIEAGARAGMVAPDETTFAFLRGRPRAPSGEAWDRAVRDWAELRSDPDAAFDREVEIDASAVAPLVTWGTSPEEVLPIDGRVPDPAAEPDPARRAQVARSLDYMGLAPGTPLTEVRVDRVFIGSCTNSRIEDLRAAAAVLRGRRAAVPGLVVPGSMPVKAQAEAEGLDRVFVEAGLEWRAPGCSMCVGMNGDLVAPGERCASTSNRNFPGRQGPRARTHLMSPAMAAAAAVAGRLADVRRMGEG